MLELKEVDTKDLINRVLAESYQTNSEVIVGEMSDQSIMVTKLPPINVNSTLEESISREEYIKKHKSFFHSVFELATDDIEKIVKKFEDHGYTYLGSRQIGFFCPCSQERMVLNLRGLYSGDIDELFKDGNSINLKCDYCRKDYQITKAEILGS
jgi:molecular chaperone Hsp33